MECDAKNVDVILEHFDKALDKTLSHFNDTTFFEEMRQRFRKHQIFSNQTLEHHCLYACHNEWLRTGFDYRERCVMRVPDLKHADFNALATHLLKTPPVVICI